MGKKDDEIIRLKALSGEQHNHRRDLETETERLHGVLKKKNEHIRCLGLEIERFEKKVKFMDEGHEARINQLNAKIKEISEHKDTMFLTVNITGEDDIDALLNQAEKSMGLRLAKKGLKDKYILLAKPDTIGIEIHR